VYFRVSRAGHAAAKFCAYQELSMYLDWLACIQSSVGTVICLHVLTRSVGIFICFHVLRAVCVCLHVYASAEELAHTCMHRAGHAIYLLVSASIKGCDASAYNGYYPRSTYLAHDLRLYFQI
jgi:hypothetical protein